MADVGGGGSGEEMDDFRWPIPLWQVEVATSTTPCPGSSESAPGHG